MSSITLQLSSELEQQLLSAATEQGIAPDLYILNTLQERFRPNNFLSVPRTEAELIQQINVGLSVADWEEYHALIAKRQSEMLTQEEYERLVTMTDCLEKLNVQRVKSMIELANLRHQPLSELMNSLGISADPEILDYA
jgi:hypothetical protein